MPNIKGEIIFNVDKRIIRNELMDYVIDYIRNNKQNVVIYVANIESGISFKRKFLELDVQLESIPNQPVLELYNGSKIILYQPHEIVRDFKFNKKGDLLIIDPNIKNQELIKSVILKVYEINKDIEILLGNEL